MRFAFLAATAFVGCTFNQPTVAPVADGPPILDGEAISADVAPPAIGGGTLLVTKAKSLFAGNPDNDTVEVFDGYTSSPAWIASTGAQSEPGRMVEGNSGFVYVVLRRAGAIAKLDAQLHTVEKHDVCPSPRGIAFEPGQGRFGGLLRVVCASGELVTITIDNWHMQSVIVDRDLRDIIPDGRGKFWISRFRSAELLHVDGDGNVISRKTPLEGPVRITNEDGTIETARYLPNTAYRLARASDGAILMLHQYATTRLVPTKPVAIKTALGVAPTPASTAPYGGASTPGSSGSPPVCDDRQLVVVAITRFVDGFPTGTDRLPIAPPAMDMAIGSSNQMLVANFSAGAFNHFPDFSSKLPTCVNVMEAGIAGPGDVVSVAFSPTGDVASQVRRVDVGASRLDIGRQVGTAGTRDTGHTIFHTPTPVGIACVSCHPEGGDDGHTWTFADVGPRRTQALRGGVLATAPFHWSGEMHDISQLAHDVFTRRMGGGTLSENQVAVLGKWLDRVPSLPAPSWVDGAAKERGSAVFASAGCTECHSGAHFTNNTSQDVGTGALFQVPSLVNVGARAPFMHDGCAPTLMARLVDPKCGGDRHGSVSALSDADRADLVQYLESL